MKISYNAAAMRASNALNASDRKVSKSLERLSSGLKVTTSKDNPSGYAIGKKMDTQILGLSVATQNSNNGISIIETADGALTEVHEMLQRMNELAVKGATGTLTTSDRMTLNEELKQLQAEVTRIATDTEFNGQPLLDGTFDLRGYTNNHQVKVDYYSDDVVPKKYVIDELEIAYKADGTIDKAASKVGIKYDGDNGFPAGVKFDSVGQDKIILKGPQDFEMTLQVEPKPIKDADGNITGYENVSPLKNPKAPVNVAVPEFQAHYGVQQIPGTGTDATNPAVYEHVLDVAATSADLKTELLSDPNVPKDITISVSSDDKTDTFLITNDSGFRMEISVDRPADLKDDGTTTIPNPPQVDVSVPAQTIEATSGLIIDITGIGSMDTQTGSNEGQQLDIRIPTISLSRLGIEKTELTIQESCSDAINEIREGILYISSVRSRLGAYQNRLEHTVNNLDVTSENMTASYSRIMDVDMAEEMTSYTTEQVISQASVSMLAQANERPSQILQLLQ